MSLKLKASLQWDSFQLQIDSEFPVQGVSALFGRSGCGKTTLLRIIAGLERVPGAEVTFAGQAWQQGSHFVPTSQRRIGLVFQEHSLLPHLSVTNNLLYGYKRTPDALRRLHPDEIIHMLDIEDLLERSIDKLSGGQRQRISLGRALLSSPQLLLLDEPLAALDTQTKQEIMPFLSRLSQEAKVPIILVTHSPDEVQRLADHVIFMQAGSIRHVESLRDALARPDTPLFQDEGAASILEGQLDAANTYGLSAFGSDDARLWLQVRPDTKHHAVENQQSRVKILARDVSLALSDPEDISMQNRLPVIIVRLDKLSEYRLLVSLRMADGQILLSEITSLAAEKLKLKPGQNIYALIKSVALIS